MGLAVLLQQQTGRLLLIYDHDHDDHDDYDDDDD